MEYATRRYALSIEGSRDGRSWRPLAIDAAAGGSPIAFRHPATVRYLRLRVPADAAVWEWVVR